jgi:hypothetical protein
MPIVRSSPVPDRWLLVVRGLTQVIVENQEGRRIGPSRDPDYPNVMENQIPGASYKPGQFFSSVFLNRPSIYTFTFIAHAPSNVHISLRLYNAVSKFHSFFFQGIPMTERSQARLVYDTADQSAMPVLALDREGNGVIEQISPTLLTPQASDDIVSPTTKIYINDNIVTLSATDNPGGAGVWRTYYTTDGITHSIYTDPFPLPPDSKIVMAYSEDRAGNLEYPGAVYPVLGISETKIVLKAKAGDRKAVQHVIDVVNLDPFPLTGPLQWEVFTEDPFLSIEPAAGLTPYSITIYANSAKLKPAPYKATVVIRALTANTVFAERTLQVQLRITAAPKSKKS